ncbi:hypothetical protein ACFL57_05410 [Candidatus Margulisiibacteriota bacterium]
MTTNLCEIKKPDIDEWRLEPYRMSCVGIKHSGSSFKIEKKPILTRHEISDELQRASAKWQLALQEIAGIISDSESELDSEIERSRHIIKLKENWDGEGSKGYKQTTWDRAVDLLSSKYLDYAMSKKDKIDIPNILPGPDGSIDILWSYPEYEVLINVPESDNKPISFYGDNKRENYLKGTLNSKLEELVLFEKIISKFQ